MACSLVCSRLFLIASLSLVLVGRVQAQGSDSVLSVVRTQLRSMGNDIGRAIKEKVPAPATLGLQVEASSGKTMLENALIEAISGAGYVLRLPGKEHITPALHVLMLNHTVGHRELQGAGFERSIRSELEARLEGKDGNVMYLGSFSAVTLDTVMQRGPVVLPVMETPADSTPSLLEKIAGPVFLITGAFLIIYLFFTVRS
ncbi:MAG: hypothetical protein HYZ01_00850 [Ignavibacteriales bacterium]|nr:hypothetical protein [Ignavibacteriales bacterium]